MIIALVALGETTAGPRPVIANHGPTLWGTFGAWGAWRAPLIDVGPNEPPSFTIYAPDGIGASYVKDDAAYSQQVWWTPRIWWQNPDGTYDHTEVNGGHSDKGWFYTWVRPGDSFGGLIAFPERGATNGAAFPAWLDASGATQPELLTVVEYPNTSISKTFVVEFILYWASNPDQPQDGWYSKLIDFGDGYGGTSGAVTFR